MLAFYGDDEKLIGSGKYINAESLPFALFDRVIDKFSPTAFKSVLEFSDGNSTEYYLLIENEKASKILKVSSLGEIDIERSIKKNQG